MRILRSWETDGRGGRGNFTGPASQRAGPKTNNGSAFIGPAPAGCHQKLLILWKITWFNWGISSMDSSETSSSTVVEISAGSISSPIVVLVSFVTAGALRFHGFPDFLCLGATTSTTSPTNQYSRSTTRWVPILDRTIVDFSRNSGVPLWFQLVDETNIEPFGI